MRLTVVTLRSLGTVARHVAVATTAVALHLTVTETPSTTSESSSLWGAALKAAWSASLKATGRSGVLTVTGDVSLSATLVALSAIHASVNRAVT